MHPARVVWSLGLVLLAVGVGWGLYVGATAEGLAALAGPIIILMATGLSVLVLAGATAWAAAGPGAPAWMLGGTGALSLAAAVGGLWIALDARAWLPWAVTAAGLVGLAATAWAWNRRAPA